MGGSAVIFARSRRSTYLLAAGGAAVMIAFGAAAVVIFVRMGPAENWAAPAVLGAGSLIGLGLVAWALFRLLSWPPNRLGFFRDRLVIVQGRSEQYAIWDRIEFVSLAGPDAWNSPDWPTINLTERLTITFHRGRQVSFEPAAFGLAPAGCRDLALQLRDDPIARRKLPEFDSALDLSTRPVVTGELITPRI